VLHIHNRNHNYFVPSLQTDVDGFESILIPQKDADISVRFIVGPRKVFHRIANKTNCLARGELL